MSIYCKHCNSTSIVRNGKVNGGMQRYLCKACTKNFTLTKRKYSLSFKLQALSWYLDGVGLRSIERNMGVSNVLLLYWIRRFGELVKQKLSQVQPTRRLEDIEIIEIDELHSYCKKNKTKFGFGLLLIALGGKLLILN